MLKTPQQYTEEFIGTWTEGSVQRVIRMAQNDAVQAAAELVAKLCGGVPTDRCCCTWTGPRQPGHLVADIMGLKSKS